MSSHQMGGPGHCYRSIASPCPKISVWMLGRTRATQSRPFLCRIHCHVSLRIGTSLIVDPVSFIQISDKTNHVCIEAMYNQVTPRCSIHHHQVIIDRIAVNVNTLLLYTYHKICGRKYRF